MTTAQWALLVACASALFTGLNVLASWLAFRRVKPRVQASFSVFTSDDTELALLVNLKNKGQYPITVTEKVTVNVAQLTRRPTPTIVGSLIGLVYRSELDMMLDQRPGMSVTVDIPESEVRDIPAFSGISFQCQLDLDRHHLQRPDNAQLYARVDSTLSNGTQCRTTWVLIWDPKSTAGSGYLPRKG